MKTAAKLWGLVVVVAFLVCQSQILTHLGLGFSHRSQL